MLNYLKNYPIKELYRLIVDGNLHQKEGGWIAYEQREPGCLQAAFNGLALAVSNLDQSVLTKEFICKLHFTCTENVQKIKKNIGGKLRQDPIEDLVGIPLERDNVSIEGIKEILDQIESQRDYPMYHGAWIGPYIEKDGLDFPQGIHYDSIQSLREKYRAANNKTMAEIIYFSMMVHSFGYQPPRPGNVFNQRFDALIASYNENIGKAKSPDDKLTIIVEFIKDCERIHPFNDANIRTFAVLLLNRLLLQNGFPPVTLANPNRFDAYSTNELVQEVKQGMDNSLALIQGRKNLFNFDSNTIPNPLQDELYRISAYFRACIDKEALRLEETQEQTVELGTGKIASLLLRSIIEPNKQVTKCREIQSQSDNFKDKVEKRLSNLK